MPRTATRLSVNLNVLQPLWSTLDSMWVGSSGASPNWLAGKRRRLARMTRKCSLLMRSPLGCAAGAWSVCRTAVGVIDRVCRTAGWHLVARTRKDRVCDGYDSYVISRIDHTFIVVGARNRSIGLGAMSLRLGVDSTDPLRTRIPCNTTER